MLRSTPREASHRIPILPGLPWEYLALLSLEGNALTFHTALELSRLFLCVEHDPTVPPPLQLFVLSKLLALPLVALVVVRVRLPLAMEVGLASLQMRAAAALLQAPELPLTTQAAGLPEAVEVGQASQWMQGVVAQDCCVMNQPESMEQHPVPVAMGGMEVSSAELWMVMPQSLEVLAVAGQLLVKGVGQGTLWMPGHVVMVVVGVAMVVVMVVVMVHVHVVMEVGQVSLWMQVAVAVAMGVDQTNCVMCWPVILESFPLLAAVKLLEVVEAGWEEMWMTPTLLQAV